MPSISLKQVAVIAARLGHYDLEVVAQGNRYACTCSCGYRSAGRMTEVLAAQAAAHHLEKIAAAWASSGASFPDAPNERTFESRSAAVA